MAYKLRKNIDAVKYKLIVLGLIFLKFVSDAFEKWLNKLKSGVYLGKKSVNKGEIACRKVSINPC